MVARGGAVADVCAAVEKENRGALSSAIMSVKAKRRERMSCYNSGCRSVC
jgi:hypothetical protein